jgi:hypothetical protein
MAKKFNIHDWQAKQWLKNQLNEVKIKKVVDQSMNNDDIGALMNIVRNYDLGKVLNTIAVVIDRTGGRPEVAQKIADLVPGVVPDEDKETTNEEKYNRLPIRDNVISYASQILNQINDYENNVGPGEQMIDYSATRETARALINAVDRDEEGMMNEHHAGDYNPGFLKQSVNTFLDKLKKKDKTDYNKVEKIMEKYFSAKKANEASMTGTGASFQAGDGEGYMTPKAFKKKRKNN